MPVVTTSQPHLFLPLYMAERMVRCSHYILLEEAQFDKYHLTSKFVDHNGTFDVRVPCQKASNRKTMDNVLVGDHGKWLEKFRRRLYDTYHKTTFFDDLYWAFDKDILGYMKTEPTVSELGYKYARFIVDMLDLEIGRASCRERV